MEMAGPRLDERVVFSVAVGIILSLSLGGLVGNKLVSW